MQTTSRPRANGTPSIESRLLEVFDALWDDLVDPREAYGDADGGWWLPVGARGSPPDLLAIR